MSKGLTTNTRQKPTLAEQKPALGFHKLIAFVATRDPARAKAFYRDTLGLHLVSEDPFALVFDVAGTMLRVATVHDVAAAQYTVLGWQVRDIVQSAKDLQRAGVSFETLSRDETRRARHLAITEWRQGGLVQRPG